MDYCKIKIVVATIIATTIFSCLHARNYQINGIVNGLQDGSVYLTTFGVKSVDTLAKTEITNGSFVIKGTVSKPTIGRLSIGGFPSDLIICLDNDNYDVAIDPYNSQQCSVITSNKEQLLVNEYTSIDGKLAKMIDEIRDDYIKSLDNQEGMAFKRLNKYLDSIQNAAECQKAVFLKEHANSMIALIVLSENASRLSMSEIQERFEPMSDDLKNSNLGEYIKEQIERIKKVEIGSKAPDFSLQSPDGKEFNLYSIDYELVLIDFWASWCSPCRKLLPEVKALYKDYHSKGLEILGVSMDSNRDAWIKAVKEENMDWLQGSKLDGFKPDNPINQLYNINNGIPHFVLIDKNKSIIYSGSSLKLIEENILKILNK